MEFFHLIFLKKLIDEINDSGFDLFIPPAPTVCGDDGCGWVNFHGSWFIKAKATVKIPLGVKLTRTGMTGFDKLPCLSLLHHIF